MLFAKTLVVLCSAAVAMAACRDRNQWEMGRWRYETSMVDGMLCKCRGSSRRENEIWTRNTCRSLGKDVIWCYDQAEFYCETGNKGTEFRQKCSDRGEGCNAVNC